MGQRYKVEDKLGEGGMGVVYRARHLDLDRLVAIKYLLEGGDTTETGIQRFKREMDVLIGLSHPNIIRVFDAGEAGGKLYYVMELLHAKDLAAVLRDKKALPAPAVVSILDQMLDALDYIHGRGLIHRDIKPGNIMLEPGGRAVLMDFGLVRKLEGTLLTTEGKLLGTPRYFPPEYLRGEEATPPGDIWSMGITMYELLCGARPFGGDTLQELAKNILTQPVPPVRSIRPDVSLALADVIARMLEKDLSKRYATAAACRQALANVKNPEDRRELEQLSQEVSAETLREGFEATTPRSTTKTKARPTHSRVPAAHQPSRAPVPASPWKRLAPALAAAALVLAAGAAFLLRSKGGEVSPPPAVPTSPTGLSVEYRGPEKLVVEFETAAPATFELAPDEGAKVADPRPVTKHKLELAVDPARAPTRLVLTGPDYANDSLRVPPPVTTRVLRLAAALRDRKIDEEHTDRLWETIRKKIPTWTASKVAEKDFGKAGGEPKYAQMTVLRDTSIAAPLEQSIRTLQEAPDVAEHLGPVLESAGALLMSKQLNPRVRSDLLDALTRLDVMDGLREYMLGRDAAVFKSVDAMRPAVSIDIEEAPKPVAAPPGTRDVALPREGKVGVCVWPLGEDIGRFGALKDTNVGLEASLDDRTSTDMLELVDGGSAGPGGRRWHLYIHGLSGHLIVHLAPKGTKFGIPIRLRGFMHGYDTHSRIVVTMRGPLAGIGAWDLTCRRLFHLSGRLYYGADVVAAESIDAR